MKISNKSPQYMYEKLKTKADFVNAMCNNAPSYIIDNFMDSSKMAEGMEDNIKRLVNYKVMDNQDYLHGVYNGVLKTYEDGNIKVPLYQTAESMAFREVAIAIGEDIFERTQREAFNELGVTIFERSAEKVLENNEEELEM